MAFYSDRTDLVSSDTNAVDDVFVRDRGTGTTTRASVSSSGEQGNGASEWPSISQDGRYVAFRSTATNLVLTDTNGLRDAFVHDRQTGQTTRVNVSSAGTEANGSTSAVAISGDGRYVAFTSSATSLAAADTDATVDLYVHDRQTGQTVLVSVSSDGTKGNDTSSIEAQALSHDGRLVAFYSYATNLVSGDTNGQADCFVHDRQTGQTTRVSLHSSGAQADGDCYTPAISGDGRYMAFRSTATNLVAGDTNGRSDTFVHDRQTGQTTRVSVSSAGEQGDNSSSGKPSMSPDGRYVAFSSSATNLVADDTNGNLDIFLHDRATGQTVRASVSKEGNQADAWTFVPAVSSYGRYVAFTSSASTLVAGDDGSSDDLFVSAKAEPDSAFLVRTEDRNGNALAYQNPANIADRGPDSVSDGLGRTLVFTYTTVGGQPYLTQIGDQAGRTIGLGYENNPSDNPGAVVLRAITDTLGNATRFGYGGSQQVVSQTLPLGNTPYTQTYSGTTGIVKTQTDAYSNTTQVRLDRYNPYVDPESQFAITYPDGATSVFTHTHDSRMAKGWADQTGRPVAYGSDALRDQFASVTDRMGGTTSFGYQSDSGKLASVTNARGSVITYTHSAQQQAFTNPISTTEVVTFTFQELTRADYPDGTNEQYTYDSRGNRLTRVDRAGQTWTYTYNSRGQVLTSANPAGGVITNTYNADGTLASRADSDTGTTTYSYDAYKRLAQVTYPDSSTRQMAYDLMDRLISVTDERGNTTTYTYNANGNLTQVTDPAGKATRYAYDLMDRRIQATDRVSSTTSYGYDVMGRTSAITDATALSTQFGYDPRGWLERLTQGGQAWGTGYDAERQPVSGTTPLGYASTTQRDQLGYMMGFTNPLSQSTVITRDALSRVTASTDPLSRTTSYAYDGAGRLISVTLPISGTAGYQRDGLGLLARITDLNGATWVFTRTAMGRLQTQSDPLGRVARHAYDSRGRLSQTTFADSAVVTRTYDQAGNLTRSLYSDGTDLQFSYDALNRVTGTTGLQLTLDAEGRVTSTQDGSVAFGAAYDAAGRLQTATYNNGAFTVTYTYSPTTGLLTRVRDSLAGAQVDFTYDADRRLTGLSRSSGVNGAYIYDTAGRLTRIQEVGQTPGQPLLDLQYTLDAAGRATGLAMTAPLDPASVLTAATSSAFTYDAASQVSTSGYTYDARGRLMAAPGQTYAWDGASRLTGVATATLAYNGLGDLRTRTVGSQTTHYHYNRALGLSPMVAEQEASSGQLLRYYVWTPEGRLLYMIDAAGGNKPYFYHFDRTGSTLALTDGTGQVSDAYAYDPHGRLLGRTGSSVQPFTFVGQWGVRQEGSSGTLYHMRARYYDAATGRFLSRDPVWPQEGDPSQLNPYRYAGNDPINGGDPLGAQYEDPNDPFRAMKGMTNLVGDYARNMAEAWIVEQGLWYVEPVHDVLNAAQNTFEWHLARKLLEVDPDNPREFTRAVKQALKDALMDGAQAGMEDGLGLDVIALVLAEFQKDVLKAIAEFAPDRWVGGMPQSRDDNPALSHAGRGQAVGKVLDRVQNASGKEGPPSGGLPPPALLDELWQFDAGNLQGEERQAQGVLDPRSIIYANVMYQ